MTSPSYWLKSRDVHEGCEHQPLDSFVAGQNQHGVDPAVNFAAFVQHEYPQALHWKTKARFLRPLQMGSPAWETGALIDVEVSANPPTNRRKSKKVTHRSSEEPSTPLPAIAIFAVLDEVFIFGPKFVCKHLECFAVHRSKTTKMGSAHRAVVGDPINGAMLNKRSVQRAVAFEKILRMPTNRYNTQIILQRECGLNCQATLCFGF